MRTYHIAWWNLENLFDEENAVALGRRTDKVLVFRVLGSLVSSPGTILSEVEPERETAIWPHPASLILEWAISRSSDERSVPADPLTQGFSQHRPPLTYASPSR
jgi:hypothetical protein